MFAVIYRDYPKGGMEEECRKGWNLVARHFVAYRRVIGSCLCRTSEGIWVAYSRWPEKKTRDAS